MGTVFNIKFMRKLNERKIKKAHEFLNNYVMEHEKEIVNIGDNICCKHDTENITYLDIMTDMIAEIIYDNKNKLSKDDINKLIYFASIICSNE